MVSLYLPVATAVVAITAFAAPLRSPMLSRTSSAGSFHSAHSFSSPLGASGRFHFSQEIHPAEPSQEIHPAEPSHVEPPAHVEPSAHLEPSAHGEPPAHVDPPAPAAPPKKSLTRTVYDGGIEELKKNPVRTAFSVVASTFAAVALAHSFHVIRDVDERDDLDY
jgi:hypothetical protein